MMKYKLEITTTSPDTLKTIAIIATLLEKGDEVFDQPDITAIDVINAINEVCCNSWIEEEDIENWLTERISSKENEERWRHTLRVRLNQHIND